MMLGQVFLHFRGGRGNQVGAYLTEYTNKNQFYEQHRSYTKWKLCIKKKPV